jgi:hypothetical protein
MAAPEYLARVRSATFFRRLFTRAVKALPSGTVKPRAVARVQVVR